MKKRLRLRASTDLTAPAAGVEVVATNETTLAAIALARAILAALVIGGFLIRREEFERIDQTIVILAFVATALVGLVSAVKHGLNYLNGHTLQTSYPWAGILLDSCLAIGAMASVDAETTPLAWLALLLPVVEAAVLFSLIPAAIVWAGLSIAFLALRLTLNPDADPETTTLALAIQQLVAVFLVSAPAALLTDSNRNRINELDDARRDADQMADRLRRIARAANDMSHETEAERVLDAATRGAISIGFDVADIVGRSGTDPWELRMVCSSGARTVPPPELLAERVPTTEMTTVYASDSDVHQILHSLEFASGHAMRMTEPERDEQVVLRVWSRYRPPSDQELQAFELLGDQAREMHRATVLLTGAQDYANRLLHEVRHDGLTGLANRRYVIDTVESRLDEGVRMAILFLDLDGFKDINDTLGHRAGDAALIAVAERLTASCRPEALVGRMGGDEFIIVQPVTAFDDVPGLTRYATELVERISAPMIADGRPAQLGASIGLALHSRGLDADQLISAADTAMYVAKRGGGGVALASGTDLTAEAAS